jgi:CDP-diacylglycerol--glycerol-3-phosphate 3-phosphatidyltransferase
MNAQDSQIWNVPNRISMARLVISIAVFVLIPLHQFWAAFWLFAIAAGTDWIDGWYARKYDQVTKLGRILDPICDKILICGVFILLAVEMQHGFRWYQQIAGWMAVLVTGRELVVTVLRSLIEGSGGDFSAKMPGKLKMVFQCVAAGAALMALAISFSQPDSDLPIWLNVTLVVSIWAAVITTVHSGVLYILAARDQLFLR